MGIYYISFGCDSPFAPYLAVIQAETEADARSFAVEYLGNHWCSVYDTAMGTAMLAEYNLTTLHLDHKDYIS
jgi:hypothetical protein